MTFSIGQRGLRTGRRPLTTGSDSRTDARSSHVYVVEGRDDGLVVGRASGPPFPVVTGLVAIAVVAFVLRVVLIDRHSAFMDEGTYVLTGRTLIEEHTMYARALDWTYGSYLWSLLAGLAHMAGGLRLVRLFSASFGVMMVVATALATARLAPRSLLHAHRWTAALIAGLIMATAPTAVGLGRFGTYDGPAGAAFMSGVALLAGAGRGGRRSTLLAGAALLFVGFLAKYLVAIYFPPICLFLLFAPRSRRGFLCHLLWCVAPLTLACALYFVAFRHEMLNLLAFAGSYTDLKSPRPLREYVWQRAEIWLLVVLAAAGWPRATRTGRGVALGGAAVIGSFHAVARPDFDWWKHSTYAIFFLAPLAALALTPIAAAVARFALVAFRWRPATGTERVVALCAAVAVVGLQLKLWPAFALWPPAVIAAVLVAPLAGLVLAPLAGAILGEGGPVQRHARWRVLAVGVAAGIAMPLPLTLTLAQSNVLTTFYPDLGPALGAIQTEAAGARKVLTDDSVLRYHLYGRLPADDITDPFYIEYEGVQGMDGYRRSIADRYWDVIVLDGGVGPIGRAMRPELGDVIARYYDRVYTGRGRDGAILELFRPREDVDAPVAATEGATIYTFDNGMQGWGAHPQGADQQPGLAVALAPERPLRGRPSLRFATEAGLSLLGVREVGPVRRVRAQVFIADEHGDHATVRIGMMGFDAQWHWRDDSFAQAVPTGRWVTVTWELTEPGVYQEIGFKLPDDEQHVVYLGSVEVAP